MGPMGQGDDILRRPGPDAAAFGNEVRGHKAMKARHPVKAEKGKKNSPLGASKEYNQMSS